MYYALYEQCVILYGAAQNRLFAKPFDTELEADKWLHTQANITRIGVAKILPPF